MSWKRVCNITLFVAILGCVYNEFFNKQKDKYKKGKEPVRRTTKYVFSQSISCNETWSLFTSTFVLLRLTNGIIGWIFDWANKKLKSREHFNNKINEDEKKKRKPNRQQ